MSGSEPMQPPALRRGRILAQATVAVLALICSVALSWTAVRTLVAEQAADTANANAGMPAAAMLRDWQIAIRMRPDVASYWQQRSELELMASPLQALASAQQAVRLNPYAWQNWHALGMAEFRLGDLEAAQAALQAAVREDRGFAAHYQLANFNLLLGNVAGFWTEMKFALAVAPASQAQVATAACLRASGNDAQPLLDVLNTERPDLLVAVAQVLLNDGKLSAAEQVWDRLRCPARLAGECRSGLGNILNAIVQEPGRAATASAGSVIIAPGNETLDANFALRSWNAAVRQGYLVQPPAHTGAILDGNFRLPWSGFGFGWTASPAASLLLLSDAAGAQIVSVTLSGMQPDREWLFRQLIAVTPGETYAVSIRNRWLGPTGVKGIMLGVQSLRGISLDDTSLPLGQNWMKTELDFATPPGMHLAYLVFRYERPLGQVPLEGQFQVASVTMDTRALAPR